MTNRERSPIGAVLEPTILEVARERLSEGRSASQWMGMVAQHAYRYAYESSYSAEGGLGLATAGGREANPYFFRGFAGNAQQAARALLAVAEVARTRYFDAGASQRMRDPVVTSNRSVLRFEAFSACNGVYARFDLEEDGFDGDFIDWGTTNVDINDPLRAALVSVAAGEPLRLSVGEDELAVETFDRAVVERKVPLPERWLRGFGEAQIASSAMLPVATLGAAQARSLIRTLPEQKTGNRPTWLQLSATGVRLSQRPADQLPSIVGPQRIGALQRLALYSRGLTVYAPPVRLRANGTEVLRPSGWVVDLEHARLTLIISPELYRGFSGEGSVLDALVSARDDALDVLSASLEGQANIDPAVYTGYATESVIDAIRTLGAAGRIGHDLHANGFFHRDLPFDRAVLDDMHPRLIDAQQLVRAGAVEVNGGRAVVRSGDTDYSVTLDDDGERCNCIWFAKHRGERGPCKHVLAAQLAAAETPSP